MDLSPLDRAIAYIGSMQKLAVHLEVTKGAVGQWKHPGRRVPAEYCPTIERLSGGTVRCEELRPDVEWGYLRKTDCHCRGVYRVIGDG